MFFKENYSFELGTFASHASVVEHIREAADDSVQFERFLASYNTGDQNALKAVEDFTMVDLSYLWALNLEVGVQSMAIYRNGVDTPIVVVDERMAWAGTPEHTHMAKFVSHHTDKSKALQRKLGAEFILKQLNLLSIRSLEAQIREVRKHDETEWATRALATIDAGK